MVSPLPNRTEQAESDVFDSIDLFFYFNSQYIVPFIVIVGCVNNIFVLVVLSLQQYRKHVNCLYLKCLAMFDTVTLVAVGLFVPENVIPTLTATLGDPFCAIMGFIVNFTPEVSSWVIVAITFTRFIAVVYPLEAAAWATFRAARFYLLGIFLLLFIAAVPDLILNRIPPTGETSLNFGCHMLMSEASLEAYHTAHMLIACVIPILILCILNVPIIYKMVKRGKETAEMRVTSKDSKDEAMVITMAMAVTIAFFLLVIPYVFHFVIWYFLSSVYMLDAVQVKQRLLSYTITNDLFAINCSINFLLYFIACRRFRQDFKSILLCRCFRT
jgi:hypothetical protein